MILLPLKLMQLKFPSEPVSTHFPCILYVALRLSADVNKATTGGNTPKQEEDEWF